MTDPLFWHRLQFGFTITFHYIFPQLTMGLALLVVVLKAVALRAHDPVRRDAWNDAARFWIRIFGLSFAFGVVTGIPMEFQFGTNWAAFSHKTGAVVGQTLAMEGIFAFFLESSFLALLIFGERKLGPRRHFAAACALLVGSWLSAYFVIVTNSFMQHPTGYRIAADGTFQVADLRAYVFNSWAIVQYLHNQMASLVTASFVMAAVGAFWTLRREHGSETGGPARVSLATGVVAALIASQLVAFPTGHEQGRLVAEHQPATLAAMEGRFESGPRAQLNLIGQPNVKMRRLDNPIAVPWVLSFLAFGTFHSNVQGLNDFPEDQWPTNIELLYYSFHVMAGLGTIFIGLMALANLQRLRGKLMETKLLLWALMLAFPFPYIANTAGWMTAELGRQPWLIWGLFKTSAGYSDVVSQGDALFTLIGFAGLYAALVLLYLFMIGREVLHGPAGHEPKSLYPEVVNG